MSSRSLLLIKLYIDEDSRCIYNHLYEYMRNNKYVIKLEHSSY